VNYAQHLDENGDHIGARVGAPGVAAAPVVVREFDPRTRAMTVIFEGPLELLSVTALGKKGSTIMLGQG
jgi:hypothetical protein